MAITINSSPVEVSGPVVELMLEDNGSAHVSFTLFIEGVTPIPLQWDETFMGTKTFTLPIAPGEYKCDIMIGAFNTNNALGPVYKSKITLNGLEFASTKGKLAKKNSGEFGFTTQSFKVI